MAAVRLPAAPYPRLGRHRPGPMRWGNWYSTRRRKRIALGRRALGRGRWRLNVHPTSASARSAAKGRAGGSSTLLMLFMQSPACQQKLGAYGFADQIEFRIAVWPEDWNAQVPIQSFY